MFKELNFHNKLIHFMSLILILILAKDNNILFLATTLVFILALLSKRRNYVLAVLFLSLSLFLDLNIYLRVIYAVLLLAIDIILLSLSLSSQEKLYLLKLIKKENPKVYYADIYREIDFDNAYAFKYAVNQIELKEIKSVLKDMKNKKVKEAAKSKNLLNIMRYGELLPRKKLKLNTKWSDRDNFFLSLSIVFLILAIFMRYINAS